MRKRRAARPAGEATVIDSTSHKAALYTAIGGVVTALIAMVSAIVVALITDNEDEKQPEPPVTTMPIQGDRTQFIRDVNFPEGTQVKVGEPHTKVWQTKNAGDVEWTNRYFTQISPSSCIEAQPILPIAPTKPGQTITFKAVFIGRIPGTCKVKYYMTDRLSHLYFPDRLHGILTIDVEVVEDQATKGD